jgi:hypothetical protein
VTLCKPVSPRKERAPGHCRCCDSGSTVVLQRHAMMTEKLATECQAVNNLVQPANSDAHLQSE